MGISKELCSLTSNALVRNTAVKRTESSSERLYKNKTWYLVPAVKVKEVVIQDIRESQLTTELHRKYKAEINSSIN